MTSLPVFRDETSTLSTTSYMLALHTAEQLTNGVSHFIEFLNMACQWNLTGVEPFVYQSRTFALRSMHLNDINGSVYYHQLLNASLMRDKLTECFRQKDATLNRNATNTQLFVPLSEFLIRSVRTITLVYFPKHMIVIVKIRQYILNKIHRGKSQAIDVSIVFISWQGKFTRPFTDVDTVRHCRLPINLIAPNQLVISKSDQFIQSLGLRI